MNTVGMFKLQNRIFIVFCCNVKKRTLKRRKPMTAEHFFFRIASTPMHNRLLCLYECHTVPHVTRYTVSDLTCNISYQNTNNNKQSLMYFDNPRFQKQRAPRVHCTYTRTHITEQCTCDRQTNTKTTKSTTAAAAPPTAAGLLI